MCGIVGYTGREAAAPIVLNGLSKLEYSGYDSAGVAVFNEVENDIDIVKTKGRLKNLLEKTDSGKAMPGGCGIGHTRWATHGAPSEKNAHPHCSDDKMVVMVHNGIIENYQELKDHLTQKGYTFYSETDTEVAVKLIAYYYEKTDHNPLESMSRALLRVRGSFALGIMFKDRPGVIYAARKDSPLIVGQNEGGAFIASDVPAILSYTRNVYYLDNMEMAELHEDSIRFFNMNGDEIEKEIINMEASRDTSYATMERLAPLYAAMIYKRLCSNSEVYEPQPVSIDGESEFLLAVSGVDSVKAWSIIDELMDVLRVVNPAAYNSVLARLGNA